MLVLSRSNMQQIVFPELGITITTLESRNGKTRLGIEAPSDIRILRGELEDRGCRPYEDGLHGPGSD